MRLAVVLLFASGCRWVFGIHDTAASGDGANAIDSAVIDGPPDSATGGCVIHSDCASGACLPNGTCADPSDIAWVNENGSGTTCTQAAPCARITTGIATARPYIRVHGTIDDTVSTTAKFTILADVGAQLIRTTNGSIFIANGGADVAIYDFEFNGAPGVTGIDVNGGATVTLERSHVRACDMGGITSNGKIVVSRSLVDENPEGGIIINGGVFTIVNSILIHNGSSTSQAGAINVMGAATGSSIELDTIAANAVHNGGMTAGGVICMTAFAIVRSYIVNNTINGDPNNNSANVNSLCDASASKIAVALDTAGFVNPATVPYDFHLVGTSPAVDQATSSAVMVDYDGQPRPQGIAFDFGADEYKP